MRQGRSWMPAAQARAGARRVGGITYQGAPCREGHSGQRYVSTGNCVACKQARRDEHRTAQRAGTLNAVLATYYTQEFDAMGWRQAGREKWT